ncbi:MAG: efflux transporter outer membrane subunit [Panacagrimonas sp.]
MKRALVLLAATAMSACALGPDYVRPEIGTPDAYRWQPESDAPGSVGDLGWWDLYRDSELKRLIETAIASNLDLRIAATRVEQAQAVLGSARLGQLPRVAGNAGIERAKSSVDAARGNDRIGTGESARIGLSWELDLWGRLGRETEAARAELLAAEYARRGVMVSLVADVATVWFRLANLDEQLRITRATVETRQQFLDLTRAQFDRGTVSGLDVATAEAQLALARASIPEFERQLALSDNALARLLGSRPDDVRRPPVDAGTSLTPEVPAGLPSTLIERRPDILQAEQALVAANARVGSAKAALFPTISLTGSFGSLSGPLTDLFTAPAETWSAGVSLLQPLLDADRNFYRVDLADARKAEALARYENAVRAGFREVSDALITRQKSLEIELAQAELVRAQQRAEEIASARYRIGYSSYFDVINADRDLFTAKLTRSSARLNARLATVQLYRALGGGWKPSSESVDSHHP